MEEKKIKHYMKLLKFATALKREMDGDIEIPQIHNDVINAIIVAYKNELNKLYGSNKNG